MGKYTNYRLSGLGPGNRYLSASEKENIQDWVSDYGYEVFFCSHSNDEPEIMSFCDTSFFAYERIVEGLKNYASLNPDILLELEYACEDDDCYELTRFKGKETEAVERVEFFPPFAKLSIEGENDQLPLIGLEFEEGDSFYVLLQREVSEAELIEIQNNIAATADSVKCCDHKKLIEDLLTAANIGFWTVAPLKVFNV